MTSTKKTVIAIGVFDGVHAGHRHVISQSLAIAQEQDARLVVASFDPHPAAVLRPEEFLGLLTLPERRTELLKSLDVDAVEYLKFDSHLRMLTPDEFVERVVVDQLGGDIVVVGSNFRFGHKAAGDVDALKVLATKYGCEVVVLDLKGDTATWSSSRIRTLIRDGDVATAHELLGRLHRVTGEVVHGDHRGRELGFPTANLDVMGGLIVPADGVYSGLLTTADEVLPAAISIGTNPTFDDVTTRRVEAYVLGRTDLDLYGQQVDLDFIAKIRGMQAFSGIDDLIVAMKNDVVVAGAHIDDFLEVTGH